MQHVSHILQIVTYVPAIKGLKSDKYDGSTDLTSDQFNQWN